jgi:phage shock protein A
MLTFDRTASTRRMEMALIRRISRLFSADMHAVLDQLEDPESLLKQAIREMEEELARQQQRSQWLEREIEATSARVESLESAAAELDLKLDTSFAHGNDALARRLTRRKLETQKLRQRVGEKLAVLRDERAEIDKTVAGNLEQLDSLRQKAELLAANHTSHVRTRVEEPLCRVDDDEVEIAFLREKEVRAGR